MANFRFSPHVIMFKSIKQFFDTLVSTMLQMNKVITQRVEDLQGHIKKQDEALDAII